MSFGPIPDPVDGFITQEFQCKNCGNDYTRTLFESGTVEQPERCVHCGEELSGNDWRIYRDVLTEEVRASQEAYENRHS